MDLVSQNLLLTSGGGKKSTFVDDVFSTYLYTGTSANQAVNNGIDLSGEGGMTWLKSRNQNYDHWLFDTERGSNKALRSNLGDAEITDTSYMNAFNNNGFTVGSNGSTNYTGINFASWTFRKAKGFFDVVTFTQSGADNTSTPQVIPHNLGVAPGLIFLKRTSGTRDWFVYHRDLGKDYWIKLNETGSATNENNSWGTTEPDANNFGYMSGYIGGGGDGTEYVAYLFAGGESTAATARSVEFDASGDYLNTTTSSSDFTMGTGDFTVEYWFKQDNSSHSGNTFQISDTSGGFKSSSFASTISAWTASDDTWKYNAGGSEKTTGVKMYKGLWYHVALVRNSGTTSLYINGTKIHSTTDNTNYNGTYIVIGGYYSTSYLLDGSLSNFRVVKGTAVYTSSFKPPTEPLTNISGTVLLCFNDSSVTGSTVTPVTLNSNGDPTASTDSPFDDPDGFKFGEGGDQNMIKTGSYIGNGSSTGPEINLGFEPSWLLIKNATGSNREWKMLDAMRGLPMGTGDATLIANTNEAETNNHNVIDLTSTGFKITDNNAHYNENGETIIYCAIRRPDGYVGKPPEAGTEVFAASLNTSNAPWFKNNNFPTDISVHKRYDANEDWYQASRLQGTRGLRPSTTAAEATISTSYWKWDYMEGWNSYTGGTDIGNYISYQWKRHAGFDVVTYAGGFNGSTKTINHSLNNVPEMIWQKNRAGATSWITYHKGLNGGTNAWNYSQFLNTSGAEMANAGLMTETPTSTSLTLSGSNWVNNISASGVNGILFLFASVDGISKVGYYAGSSSGLTITTGFAPRFLILKNITDSTTGWILLDTTRGWGSGNDQMLNIQSYEAQWGGDDVGAPTSTGFTVTTSNSQWNAANKNYIYYAHA